MEIAGIQLFTFVGFVLTIASFVVDIIGFAAPYWHKNDFLYGGIWRLCASVSSITTCGDYTDSSNLDSWLKGVQAMEVLGFLCLLGALVVVILKIFVLKDKPMLKWVAVGCLAAAAFFILVGVCVFAGESPYKNDLHFAFAFVIIAAIGAIIAAVMFCLDK